MTDELLDIFEELDALYDDNELEEELPLINDTKIKNKNSVKVFADKKFEKSWKTINAPTTACVMKTADFNKLMDKAVNLKW